MSLTRDLTQQQITQELLDLLGLPTESGMDLVVNAINQALRSPRRLHAAPVTPDTKLYIAPSRETMPGGDSKHQGVQGGEIREAVETTIDFQTGAVTGGTVNITIPSSTLGNFRRVAFTDMPDGSVKADFSAEAATVGALANAGTLFDATGEPMGYVDLESTGGTTYKTADSTTSVIENTVGAAARVHNLIRRGGQIDHFSLSNIGTNTHADIDAFIATARSYSSLRPFQLDSDMDAGDLVYLKSNGHIDTATGASKEADEYIGVLQESGLSGETKNAALLSSVSTAHTGLTPGEIVIIDDEEVGIALSTTDMLISGFGGGGSLIVKLPAGETILETDYVYMSPGEPEGSIDVSNTSQSGVIGAQSISDNRVCISKRVWAPANKKRMSVVAVVDGSGSVTTRVHQWENGLRQDPTIKYTINKNGGYSLPFNSRVTIDYVHVNADNTQAVFIVPMYLSTGFSTVFLAITMDQDGNMVNVDSLEAGLPSVGALDSVLSIASTDEANGVFMAVVAYASQSKFFQSTCVVGGTPTVPTASVYTGSGVAAGDLYKHEASTTANHVAVFAGFDTSNGIYRRVEYSTLGGTVSSTSYQTYTYSSIAPNYEESYAVYAGSSKLYYALKSDFFDYYAIGVYNADTSTMNAPAYNRPHSTNEQRFSFCLLASDRVAIHNTKASSDTGQFDFSVVVFSSDVAATAQTKVMLTGLPERTDLRIITAVDPYNVYAAEDINNSVRPKNIFGWQAAPRASGKVYRLDVTSPTRYERAMGFATSGALEDQSVKVQLGGELKGFSGLVTGSSYWASTVLRGDVVSTKPTYPDPAVLGGYAKDSETLIINPDHWHRLRDYVESELSSAQSDISRLEANRNVSLVGGYWFWDGTSLEQLDDAYIQCPGVSADRNTVQLASVTAIADDSLLVGDVNRTAGGPATITTSVIDATSASLGEDQFIIARRKGSALYLANGIALEPYQYARTGAPEGMVTSGVAGEEISAQETIRLSVEEPPSIDYSLLAPEYQGIVAPASLHNGSYSRSVFRPDSSRTFFVLFRFVTSTAYLVKVLNDGNVSLTSSIGSGASGSQYPLNGNPGDVTFEYEFGGNKHAFCMALLHSSSAPVWQMFRFMISSDTESLSLSNRTAVVAGISAPTTVSTQSLGSVAAIDKDIGAYIFAAQAGASQDGRVYARIAISDLSGDTVGSLVDVSGIPSSSGANVSRVNVDYAGANKALISWSDNGDLKIHRYDINVATQSLTFSAAMAPASIDVGGYSAHFDMAVCAGIKTVVAVPDTSTTTVNVYLVDASGPGVTASAPVPVTANYVMTQGSTISVRGLTGNKAAVVIGSFNPSVSGVDKQIFIFDISGTAPVLEESYSYPNYRTDVNSIAVLAAPAWGSPLDGEKLLVVDAYRTSVSLYDGFFIPGIPAGFIYKSDATTEERAKAYKGVALNSALEGETVKYLFSGKMGFSSGLTLGAKYWLDPAVNGGVTDTKPSPTEGYPIEAFTALEDSAVLVSPSGGGGGDGAIVAQVETTDATETQLYSLGLVDDQVATVTANVTATDGSNSAAYVLEFLVKKTAGVATVAEIRSVALEDVPAWDATIQVNTGGDDAEIAVTGEAATTINWGVRVEVAYV